MCLTNMSGALYSGGPYPRSVFPPSETNGEQDSVGFLDASRSSGLYQSGLTEVRVNALYGLHLIRAYEA